MGKASSDYPQTPNQEPTSARPGAHPKQQASRLQGISSGCNAASVRHDPISAPPWQAEIAQRDAVRAPKHHRRLLAPMSFERDWLASGSAL
jgi:hypothetical protein